MPSSRKRQPQQRAKSQALRAARQAHYAGSYAQILARLDVNAWLAKQKADTQRFCAVCKGRVKRQQDRIECQRCGRSMSVAEYVAQQEQAT